MPQYEYRCKECKQVFAIERSMSDSTPVNCSHCHSDNLARIWGANFVTSSSKSATSSSASAQGEVCASNPAKPKSCCPCD